MPEPRYRDADLIAAFLADAFADTTLSGLVEPRECGCWFEALDHASAIRPTEYGQHFPDFDGCRKPDTFADGAIVLCCTNGDRVWKALSDLGFSDTGIDRELLRRLDLYEEHRKAQQAADDLLAGIETRLERQQRALLEASAILAREFSPEAIAAAGRALRGEAR